MILLSPLDKGEPDREPLCGAPVQQQKGRTGGSINKSPLNRNIMKTDKLFYRLFLSQPSLIHELIPSIPADCDFDYSAPVIKDAEFRLGMRI
jgi:hypothetical protein